MLSQEYEEIGPSTVRKYLPIGRQVNHLRKEDGVLLSLRLLDENKKTISGNFYWLPDSAGVYTGLQHMEKVALNIEAKQTGPGKITVTLSNAKGNPVAFFNRIALVNPQTQNRILPVFYSDNYVSVPPGETNPNTLEYPASSVEGAPVLSVEGWNVEKTVTGIK